jgi:hypothetical protein
MQSLDAGGMLIEAIGEAMRRGAIDFEFVDDTAYGLFAGSTDTPFARLGPVELKGLTESVSLHVARLAS